MNQLYDTAVNILQKSYTRQISYDNGLFSAQIIEFPGCFACGNTYKEAYDNLESVALSWIEACLFQGLSIPEPESK